MFQLPTAVPLLAHTEYDWDYLAVVGHKIGKAHPDSKISMTRGKMLGGSSSANYMIYSRGVPKDYESWNRVAPGWDWETVLHYFKKSEKMEDPLVFNNSYNAMLHSTDGPVRVSRPDSIKYFENINKVYLNSFEELGIKKILEINGPETLGVTLPHFTFFEGRRSSTSEAFLIPTKNRPNLSIAKYATVTKILIDPFTKRTYGIIVKLKSGKSISIYCKKEVIVSAGAIESPKLLMLSGVGPIEELSKVGIKSIADLPVGRNLQDHPFVPLVIQGQKGIQSAIQIPLSLTELANIPTAVQCGCIKINDSFDYGNDENIIQNKYDIRQPSHQFFNVYLGAGLGAGFYYFCRVLLSYDPRFCFSLGQSNMNREISLTIIVLLHERSRGTVTLRSNNPLDNPIIDLNYLNDKTDLTSFVKSIEYLAGLAKTSHFRKVDAKVAALDVTGCEDLVRETRKYWMCYVRNTVMTLFHPAGTCAMGSHGVVDGKLRVHGIKGLRVIDASIMPSMPSGNTNAPTMMIGEKGADMIKDYYLTSEYNYDYFYWCLLFSIYLLCTNNNHEYYYRNNLLSGYL